MPNSDGHKHTIVILRWYRLSKSCLVGLLVFRILHPMILKLRSMNLATSDGK